MAIILQITDGTDTVDFNDGTNLHLGAAFQMNVGDDLVTEQIIAGWDNSLDADAKALISKKFNRLIRKGREHYRNQRIDRAVWLVWKPDDQTDTQYAKVMGGGEVEIVKHTIGGYGGGYFNPTIIREGGWRANVPSNSSGSNIVNAATVYNKSDGDGNNWVTIPNTRTNDVPAFTQIYIGGTISFDTVIVAMKRFANSTAADRFNPHFNPTDQTSAHAETADTAAPGDFRIDLTADNSITWDIAYTDLPDYKGYYHVYASTYRSSGSSTARARFFTDTITGEYVDITAASSSDSRLYLGEVAIPGTELDPLVALDTSANFGIGIQYDITGTGTYRFYGLWLIPADIPPMTVELAVPKDSGQTLILNGSTEVSMLIDTASSGAVYGNPVVPKGRYLEAHGGETNRIYFYEWAANSYTHNDQMTVTVATYERFLGLRGNT